MTSLKQYMAAALLVSLAATPVCVAQQQTQAPAPSNAPSTVSGTRVDPAAGPQTPDTPPQTTTPNQTANPPAADTQPPPQQATQSAGDQQPQTSSAQNDARPAQVPQAPAPQQNAPATPQEPVGAATAQRGVTRGGVASRPAGVAIAPAKQRQTRSLLIKTGAVLAAAVAIGTVYGLHKATGSKPPGASSSTTGQ